MAIIALTIDLDFKIPALSMFCTNCLLFDPEQLHDIFFSENEKYMKNALKKDILSVLNVEKNERDFLILVGTKIETIASQVIAIAKSLFSVV